VGTGDGRLPYLLARREPDRLFIGLDASADGLRLLSGRAHREKCANLLYVRAAVEDPPPGLAGCADRVTVVLPWGSLLAAVARPEVEVLRRVRALCQPRAQLTVLLGLDAARDQGELRRLGLPPLGEAVRAVAFAGGYAEAGFTVSRVRALDAAERARYPSTWAARLAYGGSRSFLEVSAETAPDPAWPGSGSG
jgi:16S rRNA (adenine(1408)-N(1))-methyltransferase